MQITATKIKMVKIILRVLAVISGVCGFITFGIFNNSNNNNFISINTVHIALKVAYCEIHLLETLKILLSGTSLVLNELGSGKFGSYHKATSVYQARISYCGPL